MNALDRIEVINPPFCVPQVLADTPNGHWSDAADGGTWWSFTTAGEAPSGPHVTDAAAIWYGAVGGVGDDIRHIQQLLGHASLETTALYTRVKPLDLKAAIARAHPRDQKPTRPRHPRR